VHEIYGRYLNLKNHLILFPNLILCTNIWTEKNLPVSKYFNLTWEKTREETSINAILNGSDCLTRGETRKRPARN
jgi:hypothetical protein